MKILSLSALVIALSVATAGFAAAETIDFETAFSTTSTSSVFHTEDGMEFYLSAPIVVVSNSASQGFTSRYMDFHDHDTTGYVEMRTAGGGGGLFNVGSLDVYAQPLSGGVATITSNLGDVWTSPTGGNGTATNVVLNWSGVSWIRFNSAYDISADNITFGAVPEPGTLALLGLGLLGVGIGARRRRRATA